MKNIKVKFWCDSSEEIVDVEIHAGMYEQQQIDTAFKSWLHAHEKTGWEKIEEEREVMPEVIEDMTSHRLILNSLMTPDGTILTSRHVHDHVSHIDANGLMYSNDGGLDYQHRTVQDSAPYTDLSVYADDDYELVRKSFCRGGRGKKGDEPLKWVPMNEMSDEWLTACIAYNEERGMGGGFANQLYKKELEYRETNNCNIHE